MTMNMDVETGQKDIPSDQDENQGCLGRSQMLGRFISVLAARFFYFAHTLILIRHIAVIFGKIYWYIACGFLLYIIDLCVILFKRKGREWNWFQPVVVIFLLIEVPCIWLLELDKVSIAERNYNQSAILEDFYQGQGDQNDMKVGFSKDIFTLVLEQSMLVVIIIARWLMPKGDMTRGQLSALLMVYLGTAADVVDFFSVLAEDDKLLLNRWFYMPILATWSWCMVQFIFVSTTVESNDDDDDEDEEEVGDNGEHEPRGGGDRDDSSTRDKNNRRDKSGKRDADAVKKLKEENTCARKFSQFLQSETWSIMVSVFMQDGPFVVLRPICLFYWKIRTYTNYFFTLKNALVLLLLLQLYRVIAVYQEHKRQKEEATKKMEKMKEKTKKQVGGGWVNNGVSNGMLRNESEVMKSGSNRGRMRKVTPQVKTLPNQTAWDFDEI